MKGFFNLMIFSIFSFSAFSQNNADNVIGIYLTPAKDGKISIYKKGQYYFGKLISASRNFKDTKNPNSALRSRDVVGSDFMTNFKYAGGEYVNGKIYDARTGNTYNCKMWLEGNDLKVRGFMGFSLLGRTETFKRAG